MDLHVKGIEELIDYLEDKKRILVRGGDDTEVLLKELVEGDRVRFLKVMGIFSIEERGNYRKELQYKLKDYIEYLDEEVVVDLAKPYNRNQDKLVIDLQGERFIHFDIYSRKYGVHRSLEEANYDKTILNLLDEVGGTQKRIVEFEKRLSDYAYLKKRMVLGDRLRLIFQRKKMKEVVENYKMYLQKEIEREKSYIKDSLERDIDHYKRKEKEWNRSLSYKKEKYESWKELFEGWGYKEENY